MIMDINYIEVKQPIGTFYLSSIPAEKLINIVEVIPRNDSKEGVQRELSSKRIKEIGDYCSDPDAVFPTPIVISVYEDADVIIDDNCHVISFSENRIIGQVIDGQHRLGGIKQSDNKHAFDLPVVFMFGMTIEEKAYVFSTINSNQTKVNLSLIYDLFGVSKMRSPQKTAHEIARVMNYNVVSPFYDRLKMLGKKEMNQEHAILSQGTFATSILQLITKKPDKDRLNLKRGYQLEPDDRCPFRQYFIEERDEVIIKILLNCFNALKDVFREEWETPEPYILWKTTGFKGVIYAMPNLYEIGINNRDLSQSFFTDCFARFRKSLHEQHVRLTSEYFPGGGEQNQRKFAKYLTDSLKL